MSELFKNASFPSGSYRIGLLFPFSATVIRTELRILLRSSPLPELLKTLGLCVALGFQVARAAMAISA